MLVWEWCCGQESVGTVRGVCMIGGFCIYYISYMEEIGKEIGYVRVKVRHFT